MSARVAYETSHRTTSFRADFDMSSLHSGSSNIISTLCLRRSLQQILSTEGVLVLAEGDAGDK